MTIRRGGSPRDGGSSRDDGSAPDGGSVDTPSTLDAGASVPDFLQGRGSIRDAGASLRGASPLGVSPSSGSLRSGVGPRAPQPPLAPRPDRPPATGDEPEGPPSWRQSLPRITLALPSLALPSGVQQGLSVAGLAVVAVLSYGLLTGNLPSVAGGGGQGPIKTPTPSNVVVVDPRANVPGTLVYVKDGNLWLQSGASARQLTTGGRDAMPTWAADGQWIYFIRTTAATGHWPENGVTRTYDLEIPAVVRIHPDGTGFDTLLSGRIKAGSDTWQSFIRQPFPAPDGSRVVVVTDHPTPWMSDVVLKILNLNTGALVNPQLADVFPLGHQDPAWSPDGKSIAYVKDARSGTRGTPVIERYDLASKRVTAITGPGYLGPAWSPDGRYLAATKTGSFGTDVVILNARTGAELLRLTSDESSFDPVWSPAGDAIAFFRVDHGVVDLELTRLTGTAPNWSIGDSIALTVSAGLDAASRPSWFIPAEQLPTPAPSSQGSAQPFPTLHGPSPTPGVSP